MTHGVRRSRRLAATALALLTAGTLLSSGVAAAPRLAGATPIRAPQAVTPVGPWSALGSNGAGNGALNGAVTAITVAGNVTYVGGSFTNVAGIPEADYVAKWNGTSWSALGSNGFGEGALGAKVTSIAVEGSIVYVAGSFINAAGIAAADYVAQFNGSTWSSLGSNGIGDGAITYPTEAIVASGSDVYLGGGFQNAAGIVTADYVAKWNGSAWSALGSNGAGNGAVDYTVYALALSGSDLYVGGVFQNVAGLPTADRVARWNGSAWSALGSNGAGNGALSQRVMDLEVRGSDLYLAGEFQNAGGILTADFVTKWNGSSYAPLGSNGAGNGALNSSAYGVTVLGTDVYVGGAFTNVLGIPEADILARWTGTTWTAVGSNGAGQGALNNYNCCELAVASQYLYAGGVFTNAGAIATADYIARWSGVPFTDIAGTSFEQDIIWVWLEGITSGCSPSLYCPNANVTRGEMASFLARALALPSTPTDYFTDDNGTTHEANINKVAAAGITSGCSANLYCPGANVTRGEMASFLARALALPSTVVDYFTDDNGTTHETNINRLRHANLTSGCTATTYCPTANVTRGQMAAFLHRALE